MTEYVTSTDGVPIAFHRVGSGPPVVAVHGGLGTWRSWARVADLLADRFEFLLVERRGRGDSGDATEHSLEHEVDDVRAVLDRAGAGAALVGHSYGGALALEAARTASQGAVTAIAVYEPAVGVGNLISRAEIDRCDELVALGDLDAALAHGLAQLDTAGLVAMAPLPPRSHRPPALLALTPTIPRELRAVAQLGAERYAQVTPATQVLIGTHSPPPQRDACERLAAALPDASVARLEGLGHVAHTAAPDAVATALGPFLVTHLYATPAEPELGSH
jgi:pimeloyl-ACP methyl ester carboxylesterase